MKPFFNFTLFRLLVFTKFDFLFFWFFPLFYFFVSSVALGFNITLSLSLFSSFYLLFSTPSNYFPLSFFSLLAYFLFLVCFRSVLFPVVIYSFLVKLCKKQEHKKKITQQRIRPLKLQTAWQPTSVTDSSPSCFYLRLSNQKKKTK